jgi:hypothetical protein
MRFGPVNESGFSLAESMISLGLVATVVVMGVQGSTQLSRQGADARAVAIHGQVHNQVYSALADVGSCHQFLKKTGGSPLKVTDTGTAVPVTVQRQDGKPVVEPGTKLATEISGPAKFDLTVEDWGWRDGAMEPMDALGEAIEPGTTTPGRLKVPARIVIRGTRTTTGDTGPKIVTRIPLILQFNIASQTLEGCVLNAGDLDPSPYLLAAAGRPAHTSLDCAANLGMPFPTPWGYVCRIPNMEPTRAGRVRCPAGWTTLMQKTSFFPGQQRAWTATEPNPWVGRDCDGNETFCWTGWHPLSARPIETCGRAVAEGTKDGFNEYIGIGGAVAAVALGAGPIGIAAAIFVGIFAGKKDCDNETMTSGSKVVSVACF